MGSEVEVNARRLEGKGQAFALSAEGDDRRWAVRQWASKPRRGQLVPYWYEHGKTWHLFKGELPEGTGDDMPPPEESFTTMAEVKDYVRSLVAGGPPATSG